jgi:lincosamide nucleotidyltransferase A/C/D/E
MVSAEDAVYLCKLFSNHGIQVWLTGGWGIDALLEQQTRQHHDLDVLMLVDDVSVLLNVMHKEGYGYKELWSENLWSVDANGTRIETAFFVSDPEGRELDAHALRLDEQGNGIPAWERDEGFIMTSQYLAGMGTIAGYPVRCMSAEYQMISHTGYELPDKQVPDLMKLHEKFAIAYPDEISRTLGSTGT